MGEYTTTRSKDILIEKAAASFLDEYFYSKAALASGVEFRRTSDKDEQLRGVDVVYGKFRLDEKVKIKGYINRILEYPSFELSFVNRSGRVQVGWVADKNRETDYYVFIAVFADIEDEYQLTKDNIKKLNLLFVKKEDLFMHIANSESKVWEDSLRLRKSSFIDRIDYPHDEFYLKMSRKFSESPINIVYRRYVLKGFEHTKEVEVTREGYRII